ncbi:MAG TPA: CobQ/CobB/MinD/ParA nucleotide binding domain-containing protein [Chloroflexi bacterium]|mgnify:CR=1 FL=1|nr:CobQ/CobB/MinD/ParA nucleotide binding domain-containing protein [Chloroflexota bacterium]
MSPQSGERIKVLLIDDIAETRENLRKLLSFDPDIEVIGAAASGFEGLEMVREFHPHVVLMDINMPGMDGIAATEAVLKEAPATQVVMLSVQGETDYLRRAMLAGARDFLTKPSSGDELMSTIRRVYEMGKDRVVTQPAAAVQEEARRAAAHLAGDIVAVFSPKGGVGCTTVAVNLAVALQKALVNQRKVALMDASIQFGDVGVMLNLQTNRSIVDLVQRMSDMDVEILRGVMSAHGSGLKVLLAPPNPEEAESVLVGVSPEDGGGAAAVGEILKLMRTEFDLIVVDMWSWIDDIALTIFDAATLIILVVMPNIPSIKSARLFLEVADRLNYPREKIALVVNGVDRRMGIRVEQIEQAMIPVVAQIPLEEQTAIAAVNHGVPFVLRDENRPISQSVLQLAEHVRGVLVSEQAEKEEEEREEDAVTRLRLSRVFG